MSRQNTIENLPIFAVFPMPSVGVIQHQQSTTLVKHQYSKKNRRFTCVTITRPQTVWRNISWRNRKRNDLNSFVLHRKHYLLSENQNTSKWCYPIMLTSIFRRYLHLKGQFISMGYDSTIRSKYEDSDFKPFNWGWQLVGDSMTQIMTDEEAENQSMWLQRWMR